MVFETNLHIEAGQQEKKPLFLLLLDYKKFFDFIIQDIVWGLAAWWGDPRRNGEVVEKLLLEPHTCFQV